MSLDQFEMMDRIQQQEAKKEATENAGNNQKEDSTEGNITEVVNNGQEGNEDGNTASSEIGTDEGEAIDPNGEGGAVDIPDDLKEHAGLLESRGWKGLIGEPEKLAKEVLKSYAEAEKALGQKGNTEGVLTKKMEELENVLTSTPDKINEVRKQYGLEPIQILDHEAKAAEIVGLFDKFKQIYEAVTSGTPNVNLERELLAQVKQIEDDARIQSRIRSEVAGRQPDLKMQAHKSINAISQESGEKYDDIVKRFDSVDKDQDIANFFREIAGVNMLPLVATSTRAKGFNKLMKLVERGMNFDVAVKAEVEKQLAQKQKQIRTAQNAGGFSRGANSPHGKQVNQENKQLFEFQKTFR